MRRIALLVVLAAFCAAAPAAALADGAPVFVTNAYANCVGDDNIGVPNGDDLQLHLAWAAVNPGLIHDFVNGTDMTVTIGGVPVANPAQYWSKPQYLDSIGYWVTIWSYDVGVITFANPTSLEFSVTATHAMIDGATFDSDANHRPFFYDQHGPIVATSAPCSITAF